MAKNKFVFEIAKWFIKKGYDEPRNKFDGNIKLQKLLYFSQLVHLYKYEKLLFEEPLRAFEKGPVVECVRQRYKNDNYNFIKEAERMFANFNKNIIDTLELTVELFGNYSAKELSNLTHNHECWHKALKKSKNESGFYEKDKSIIPIEEIKKTAVENIGQLIKAKEMTTKEGHECEVVNGTNFYYDPEEIKIDDDLLKKLNNFNGEDRSYTIYKDPSQGLVIY